MPPHQNRLLPRVLLSAALFVSFFWTSGAEAAGPGGDIPLTLRLLVWEGYAPAPQQKAFIDKIRNRYGVALTFSVRDASNPDAFFNELRKGAVDIISPAHNLPLDSRYNFITSGLALPVNLDNVPNYKDIAPSLQHQPWALAGGKTYAVPIVQGPYGLAYNADKVTEAPVSWGIFWDPRYAGQYVVHRDYYELNVYISALSLGYPRNAIFHYDAIKGPLLEKRIRQLAVNAASLWTGFDKPAHFRSKALATTWRCSFPELNRLGETWRIAVPREGTTWWIDTLMLSHTLKNKPLLKKIAEEWINFLLEAPIQTEALALKLGIYPVTRPAMALFDQQQTGLEDASNQRRLLRDHINWERLHTRDRNAFHLLWEEALAARHAHAFGK